jgi:hypothetical protein
MSVWLNAALCTFDIWSYEVARLGPARTIDS